MKKFLSICLLPLLAVTGHAQELLINGEMHLGPDKKPLKWSVADSSVGALVTTKDHWFTRDCEVRISASKTHPARFLSTQYIPWSGIGHVELSAEVSGPARVGLGLQFFDANYQYLSESLQLFDIGKKSTDIEANLPVPVAFNQKNIAYYRVFLFVNTNESAIFGDIEADFERD